ncbi:MAG: histidine phosphatase family protein [Anaerolineae bacterium]|nr:histidine phosphatase family protein [Anaerolineae bacterium]
MQFYYVRHGQSTNNSLYSQIRSNEGRSEDPELTPNGVRQAEHLARYLSQPPPPVETAPEDRQNANGFALTHIYTSLMVRAVATAHHVAEVLDLPLLGWEDLHEEWGIYLQDEATGELVGLPGKDRAYFRQHYPRLVVPDSVRAGGWWNRPPEPPSIRPARARRIVRDLLARHGDTDDRVAVVSHGGTYQHVMATLLDMPLEEERGLPAGVRFSLNNAAITRIDFDDVTRMVYCNRVDHLPRELIT